MYPNRINDLDKPEKFTLCYEGFKSKIVHEFSGEVTLTEALEQYEQFLLGCGYRFKGTLDIVDDEQPSVRVLSTSTQELLLE